MRFSLFFFFLSTSFYSFSQSSYSEKIKEHRKEINDEFMNPETSILKAEELEEFNGLEFFEPDVEYNVRVKFKKHKSSKTIGFSTSTDRIAKYREYGTVKFKIDGKKCKLTLYEPARPIPGYPGYLFIPFNDHTNGEESYGGGRYLDLKTADTSKKFYLDFNLCYHPYCAYSDGYSCPVPPEENKLEVKIKAGVKLTPAHH